MALDESKETDAVFEVEGYKYVVSKDFLGKAKSIKVDYQPVGFKLTAGVDFFSSGASACSSCSTTGCG